MKTAYMALSGRTSDYFAFIYFFFRDSYNAWRGAQNRCVVPGSLQTAVEMSIPAIFCFTQVYSTYSTYNQNKIHI